MRSRRKHFDKRKIAGGSVTAERAPRPEIVIDGRKIGPAHPPYIVAELSGNHNGNFARAIELMDAAKAAGADAIKLQTYTADTITIDHDGPGFVIEGGLWDGRTLYDLYQEAHTPWEWHEALFVHARAIGISIFSTPFDPTAIAFLKTLGAPAYKVASFEVVDLPLVEQIASLLRPTIISTGMASLPEIEEAVGAARMQGLKDIALLHCVSGYPTPAGDANLRTIPDLAQRFGLVTGLSDHTLGTAVAVAAVGLGAAIIEKHVTLRRADGGPDAAFSLEPNELARLVTDCRTAWEAIGDAGYALKDSEKGNLMFRRSLYAVRDIAEGELLTDLNVRSIRPGYGLPPKELPGLLGRRAAKQIARGTPLDWSVVSEE
jgi:pseudaminic acid synthase